MSEGIEGTESAGLRARGEDAISDLAQAVLENPVLGQALSAAFGAGQRAAEAQKSALSAAGLASGADLERLERRLRALSSRLEALEDRVDDLGRGPGPPA